MSTYSIHRLLSLKKTTADRIEKVIQDGVFIDISTGRKTTTNGIPVSQRESEIKSDYQKVNSLISNYGLLKSALLRSNSGIETEEEVKLRTVTVMGNQYTLSELIAYSDEIYGNKKHQGYKSKLLTQLKSRYAIALRKIEAQNAKVEQEFKDYLSKTTTAEKLMSSDDIKQRSEIFHADGDYSLIDPLNLKSVIESLESEINQFRQECDSAISESNALTVVHVNLTEV